MSTAYVSSVGRQLEAFERRLKYYVRGALLRSDLRAFRKRFKRFQDESLRAELERKADRLDRLLERGRISARRARRAERQARSAGQ